MEYTENIEKLLTKAALTAQKVEIDSDATLFIISDANRETFDSLASQASKEFPKTAVNQIGENAFCFVGSESALTSLRFYPNTSEIRVTCDAKNDYLAVFPEHCGQKTTAPLLTQGRMACMNADCGMSYVLRATDGRFVLIDGGEDDYEESERLFDLLSEQANGQKPVIAACIITHLHSDHMTAFCRLWKDHKEDFVLESLIYSIVPDKFNVLYPHTAFDSLLPEIKESGTALITAHTGMKFVLSDLVIEMLYAPDDCYPNVFSNFNDSSLIFRADFAGRQILFLGDAMPLASDVVAKRYDKSVLKSEFLQVGHHGYGGGSEALYRACDPETLLWPCPAFWYPSVRLWPSNDYLRNSPNIRHIFLSGFGTVTLDMTKPVVDLPEKHFSKGETVYEQDFQSVKRLVDLQYECVTGGATGLSSPQAAFETDENGRYLRLKTAEVSLIGLVSQKDLAADSYIAEIELCAPQDAEIGLMAANDMPNEWQGDKTRWFVLAASKEPKKIQAYVDYPTHTLTVTIDGKAEKYPISDSRGGFYLALHKADVAVYHVKITAQ